MLMLVAFSWEMHTRIVSSSFFFFFGQMLIVSSCSVVIEDKKLKTQLASRENLYGKFLLLTYQHQSFNSVNI